MIKPAHLAYRRLTKAGRLALACDFDGALADDSAETGSPTIIPAAREALQSLAMRGATDVIMLSARPLNDLVARAGIEGVGYSGCSGLELRIRGRVRLPPNAEQIRERMSAAALRLEQSLEGTGARVEDRGYTVWIDWQDADGAEKAVRRGLRRLDEKSFTPVNGESSVEVLPYGHGGAVDGLRSWLSELGPIGNQLLVFVGGTAGNTALFHAVRSLGGVTLCVGSGANTDAEFRLAAPAETARFLHALAEVRAPYPEARGG